jgi:hypothetical protein
VKWGVAEQIAWGPYLWADRMKGTKLDGFVFLQ